MVREPTMEEALRRRRDLTFLGLLGALLVATGIVLLYAAYPPHRDIVTSAGEIRAVDPGLLKRLLRSGHLSDHEAEHYRRAEGAGKP